MRIMGHDACRLGSPGAPVSDPGSDTGLPGPAGGTIARSRWQAFPLAGPCRVCQLQAGCCQPGAARNLEIAIQEGKDAGRADPMRPGWDRRHAFKGNGWVGVSVIAAPAAAGKQKGMGSSLPIPARPPSGGLRVKAGRRQTNCLSLAGITPRPSDRSPTTASWPTVGRWFATSTNCRSRWATSCI